MKVIVCAAALALSAVSSFAQVKTGLDVLADGGIKRFEGKRVGIITNHTGLSSSGESAVKIFASDDKIKVAAIFSPEHGFSGAGAAGENIRDTSYDGIPVVSLYGKTMRLSPEMLKDVDVLVFDIQDIGARFYTYLTTMAYAMEEADRNGKDFVVLDRPNPINGTVVEGPVLDKNIRAFTAYLQVPTRHGMTAGEVALLHAAKMGLKKKPEVIKMSGWKREMFADDAGQKWINPSPNIRSLDAGILYAGIGCFEAANISVGRGTASPFTWIGAPWLDSAKIVAYLQKAGLKGVEFYPEDRTPDSDVYAGKKCNGVAFRITDRKAVRPLEIFVSILCALRDSGEKNFEPKWDGVARMTGNNRLHGLYVSGASPRTIIDEYNKEAAEFLEYRKQFLLY